MYQGGNTEINEQEKQIYGFGGAVVLKLINDIVKSSQHYLYFDNFFTSFNLIHALDEMKIYATGTARTNRFVNPPLLSDKTMSNLGRGASFEISSAVPNTNIGMLKWYDSKSVVLVTNCVTSGTPDTVRRWNKNKKIYEKVDRPEIIRNYNTSMGGVDKHDMLISLFRTHIKSNKWTLRLITHAFDMATTNSWLEYRIDANNLGVEKINKYIAVLSPCFTM